MIELLENIKQAKDALFDAYDLVLHDSRCHVHKRDVEEAKKRVEIANSFVIKLRKSSNKLSDSDLRRYHSMVNRALQEPTYVVLFKHMENGMGIENILGNEKFYFVE